MIMAKCGKNAINILTIIVVITKLHNSPKPSNFGRDLTTKSGCLPPLAILLPLLRGAHSQ